MDRNSTTEQVARHVAEQIKEHGVTLTWLCEKTGIPRVTLHRRLSGQTPFNLNELDRIADALRIETTDLLGVAA